MCLIHIYRVTIGIPLLTPLRRPFISVRCWARSWSPPMQHLNGIRRVKNSGWWFGCHQFYVPINIGNLIIPIDELIFFRGVGIQPPTSETCGFLWISKETWCEIHPCLEFTSMWVWVCVCVFTNWEFGIEH